MVENLGVFTCIKRTQPSFGFNAIRNIRCTLLEAQKNSHLGRLRAAQPITFQVYGSFISISQKIA
jgi:hypothetical protein